MDKYLKFILDRVSCAICVDVNGETINGLNPLTQYINSNEEFEIKQNDDYNIKKHYVFIGGELFSSVKIDGKKVEVVELNPGKFYRVEVDFDNRAKELRLEFEDGLAEPTTFKLRFVEADHAIHDAKVQAQINESIKPEHKTGQDLVNIYWNLVSEKVALSQVNLYVCSDGERLVGRFKETEMTFKSVTGLAYGTYLYEIIEFDKDGKELARTGKIEFRLAKPVYGGNGRHVVTNR